MGRTWSNHESNRVEPWVELSRITGRTGSNEVKRGRTISQTGSNHESNKVNSLAKRAQS